MLPLLKYHCLYLLLVLKILKMKTFHCRFFGWRMTMSTWWDSEMCLEFLETLMVNRKAFFFEEIWGELNSI